MPPVAQGHTAPSLWRLQQYSGCVSEMCRRKGWKVKAKVWLDPRKPGLDLDFPCRIKARLPFSSPLVLGFSLAVFRFCTVPQVNQVRNHSPNA